MAEKDDFGPLAFFRALHQAFGQTLAVRKGHADLVEGLMAQAFDSFAGNAEIQAEGHPPLACHKGCATCCTLRVVATAPEIFLVARYIRNTAGVLAKIGVDLRARIAAADLATRGFGEAERVTLRRQCPFIITGGVCCIYPVRPLACRGHASYDVRACAEAAAGKRDEVPVSLPHATVRSLVQNAMQSALRDAGYAWLCHELNHGLTIALDDGTAFESWAAGEDVLAPARVADIRAEEMARTFDAIAGR